MTDKELEEVIDDILFDQLSVEYESITSKSRQQAGRSIIVVLREKGVIQ